MSFIDAYGVVIDTILFVFVLITSIKGFIRWRSERTDKRHKEYQFKSPPLILKGSQEEARFWAMHAALDKGRKAELEMLSKRSKLEKLWYRILGG